MQAVRWSTGAKVEAMNQATGETRSAATDSQGEYRFLNVDPGQYTITASAPQFATTKDENVVVLARETSRSEIRLEVKGAQQTVVVEEDSRCSAKTSPTPPPAPARTSAH